jgi:hypothetical protein
MSLFNFLLQTRKFHQFGFPVLSGFFVFKKSRF